MTHASRVVAPPHHFALHEPQMSTNDWNAVANRRAERRAGSGGHSGGVLVPWGTAAGLKP